MTHTTDLDRLMERGTRWLEVSTNRVIVIAGPGPDSPWWYYEDDRHRQLWHCCIEDFTIWGRFRRVMQ